MDDWYTPDHIIDACYRVLGHIDLDPASCDVANEVVQAKHFYTKFDDSLNMRWSGKVFLNPPYSRGNVDKFAFKFISSLPDITEGLFLCNSSTDSKWFKKLSSHSDCLCFFSPRLRFWTDKRSFSYSRQPQCILYFGSNVYRFCEVFGEYGILMYVL